MIEYNELEAIEISAINQLWLSCKPYEDSRYIRFDKTEVDSLFKENIVYHSDRIIEFLKSNDFIKLFSYKPDYELLEEGKRLLKYGTLEKYYEKLNRHKITDNIAGGNPVHKLPNGTTISGNNNVVNIAGESVSQSLTQHINRELQLQKTIKQSSLINIDEGSINSKLPYFQHCVAIIKLKNITIATNQLYNKLFEYRNTDYRRISLSVFDGEKHNVTSKSMELKLPLKSAGVDNHFKESVLQIKPNQLQFEFAQYKSIGLRTSMSDELLPVLTLIYFCNGLYKNSGFDIDVIFSIETNGELTFLPNRNVISVFADLQSTYTLNPNKHMFEDNLKDLSNLSMNDFVDKVISGFVADSPFSKKPFLSLDEDNQNRVFNSMKGNLLHKPLSEL